MSIFDKLDEKLKGKIAEAAEKVVVIKEKTDEIPPEEVKSVSPVLEHANSLLESTSDLSESGRTTSKNKEDSRTDLQKHAESLL